MGGCRRRWLGGLAALLALGAAAPAAAYEFEVRALTIGQGYQLRSFRLLGSDLLLDRRRFTQTLSLAMWDLAGARKGRSLYDPKPRRGPDLYFAGMLRIDHDFGEYTAGELAIGAALHDAVDLIPELGPSNLGLEVLYAYVGGDDVFGVIDFKLGRQLGVDTLDWWSYDGLTLRAEAPFRVAFEAFGGLRVRDQSPLGSNVQEPDGTGSSECAEFFEDALPGSGAWRPVSFGGYQADFCPQRRELMPTFGGSVETHGLHAVHARLAYRRTVSRTAGPIAPADQDGADPGLYPGAPDGVAGWGVNEERVTASVRGQVDWSDGRGQLTPFAAARYSLLHALVDEALAGLRVRHGAHSLAPEVFYSYPTFDGDSIFNVFSIQPYADARLTYELAPRAARMSGYLRGWLRRFEIADPGVTRTMLGDLVTRGVDGVDDHAFAGGAQLGGRWRRECGPTVRLDLFHEDGYGGRRTGGFAASQWELRGNLNLSTRLSVISFEEDLIRALSGTSLGVQAGATYQIASGVVAHLLVEENTNPIYQSQLRVIGVLDLAFNPEL